MSSRALGVVQDAAALPALLACLSDDEFDVCWEAAEAARAFGEEGVLAVLRFLLEQPLTRRLAGGAMHVLSRAPVETHGVVRPVLRVLPLAERAVAMPPAANAALERRAGALA